MLPGSRAASHGASVGTCLRPRGHASCCCCLPLAQALTAAVLSALSDLLAQRLAGTARTPVNWRRTLAIGLYGFIWAGPTAHFWQQFLASALPKRKRDSSVT